MKETKKIIGGLRIVERLKTINREAQVNGRQESTAEHTYNAILIADMLAEYYPKGVDVQKVKDLVLYHDLVEVHAGDVGLSDEQGRKNKQVEEYDAFKQLLTEIPNPERYKDLYEEYEACQTIEAVIAKKIDLIEVLINSTNENRIAKDEGYSEQFLRKAYQNNGQEIPILDEICEDVLGMLREQKKI